MMKYDQKLKNISKCMTKMSIETTKLDQKRVIRRNTCDTQ